MASGAGGRYGTLSPCNCSGEIWRSIYRNCRSACSKRPISFGQTRRCVLNSRAGHGLAARSLPTRAVDTLKQYKADEVIYHIGDPPNGMFGS
jgi:hypothetical protein